MADDAQLQQQKRALVPYLDRAQEIEKVQPKVAYYCRLYAVEQAVGMGTSTLHPLIKDVLITLTGRLEKDKAALQLEPAGDAKLCEKFARLVFDRADKMDRAGKVDDVTKRTFVYADQYLRVLSRFGELPPEVAKLQKYARWRAVALSKALREGRLPEPPPLLEGMDMDAELMSMLNSLPEVPQSNAPPPAAAAAAAAPVQPPPAADALPPRLFSPGQVVLYCPQGTAHAAKMQGTVESCQSQPGARDYYIIALNDGRRISADPDQLAHRMDAGASVLFYPPSGGPAEEAEVEEVYMSRWPPVYLVKTRPGGSGLSLIETEDERLAPIQAAPAGGFAPNGVAGPTSDGELAGMAHELEQTPLQGWPQLATQALPSPPGAPSQPVRAASSSSPFVAAALAGTAPVAGPPVPAAAGAAPAASSAPAAAGHMASPPPVPAAYMPPQPPSPPPPPMFAAPPPRQMAPPPPQPASAPAASPIPEYTDVRVMMEAQKLTKEAGNALNFEDVPTALKQLQQAISLLTTGKRQ